MAFRKFNRENFSSRQTFKGNWKCSECGSPITELPFQPNQDRPIYCKECWQKKRQERFSR